MAGSGASAEQDFGALACNAHRWLTETAWPLWLARGIDRERGGFHEHLSHETLICAADFRRLRVVTRQITVFAAAEAAEAVQLGCDFLHRARQPDGGYAWRFDLEGTAIDHTRDLYDHGFVLLAWSRAGQREPALAVDQYLQAHFRHPLGGYREAIPDAPPRRQNPHMHLFEAYLAAAETWPEAPFWSRAVELAELFHTRLFQYAEQSLPEYFDDTLTPLRENGRFIAEPGHCAEWIWLLRWFEQSAIARGETAPAWVEPAIAALTATLNLPACRNEFGALIDEIWSDGSVRTGSARLWPQTERLKAEVMTATPDPARIAEAFQALGHFIAGAPPGLWHERWTPQDGFAASPAPASSLYHLTGGILEALKSLRRQGVL